MNIEEALNQFFEKLRRRLESLEQAINTLPCDNYLWGNWREDEKILSSEEDALETTEYTNREMPLDAKDIDVPTNRWISVKDRLPEKNHAVLGWYKDNPFAGYTYGVVSWNGKGWVFVYAQRYVTNVTHWQPMPLAPEVKND